MIKTKIQSEKIPRCRTVASRDIQLDKKEKISKMTQYLATEYRKGEILNMKAVLK